MQQTALTIGSAHPALSFLVYQQELVMMVATFGGMLLLLMLETLWPRRSPTPAPVFRWVNNWLLAAFNFTAVLWLLHLLGQLPWLSGIGRWNGPLASVHPVLAFVLVLLIFEAVGYALHRLYHAVPLLWRFHAVHHLDTEVDATTSHRHHTVEVSLNSLLFVPVVALLGAPLVIVALVALLRLCVNLYSHSNLAIPARIDHILRWVLITPDFHRLHHSADPAHTNSNYGTVLPWFDYLFGTARTVPYARQTDLQLGLPEWRDAGASRLDRLLLLPLRWSPRRAAA